MDMTVFTSEKIWLNSEVEEVENSWVFANLWSDVVLSVYQGLRIARVD